MLFMASILAFLWPLCLLLSAVRAQNVAPSNDTSTSAQMTAPGSPQLILRSSQTAMVTQVNVDPLTNAAGFQQTTNQLSGINITGTLVLTTYSNTGSLGVEDIAYISCDPAAYINSNIDAARTVNYAASHSPKAIVLYSTTSIHCTFSVSGDFVYDIVYSMTNASKAITLQDGLRGNAPPGSMTSILLDQSSLNNSTGNILGPSPTTAVAMIILYSITGIITALFLIIIIIGAIRAHRHPERYGPRNVLGRTRQSRAKGIARAMLETIPIVKFGEKEEGKEVSQGGDVEMGPTGNTAGTLPTRDVEHERSSPESTEEQGQTNEGPDTVRTVPAAGTMETIEGRTGAGNGSDNGLACSVCTDDFIKGQDIRVLPCKHKFHPECIDPWLLNVSGTCPLCRVELRPTAPQTGDATSPPDPHTPLSPTTPNPYISTPTPSSEPSTSERRRSRTGLSLYLQHTLNVRRMRDATPEERIAALRRLRTVDRANEPPAEAESRRGSVATRLSRAWRPGARVSTATEDPVSDAVNVSAGDEEEGSAEQRRAGTFAG